jgi:hypothetical protein
MLATQAQTALADAARPLEPAGAYDEVGDTEPDDLAPARGLVLGMLLGAASLGGLALLGWALL